MNIKNYLNPTWSVPSSVKAYTTTRLDGLSLPPFDTFNLGSHVGDQEDKVIANRKKLAKDLCLPNDPVWLNQVHGCDVGVLSETPSEILSVDAVVTSKENLVCAVLTADCLPILLCNSTGTQVAAIHAGWRGLASGIIFETLKKMESGEIIAWLGPAIGPTAFEIDEKTKEALSNLLSSEQRKACFRSLNSSSNKEKKYLANLYQIATYHLIACGANKISGGEYCTYNQSDLFFSYRRISKMNQISNKILTGRMASLIWISR